MIFSDNSWPAIAQGNKRMVLTICLLIRKTQKKCVAESNNLLGLHRLLNPTSHCTNYGSDLLDPTVCMHFTV